MKHTEIAFWTTAIIVLLYLNFGPGGGSSDSVAKRRGTGLHQQQHEEATSGSDASGSASAEDEDKGKSKKKSGGGGGTTSSASASKKKNSSKKKTEAPQPTSGLMEAGRAVDIVPEPCQALQELYASAVLVPSRMNQLIPSLLSLMGGGATVGEVNPVSAHLTLAMLRSDAQKVVSIVQHKEVLPTVKYLHLKHRVCHPNRTSFVSSKDSALENYKFDVLAFGTLAAAQWQQDALLAGQITVSSYLVLVDGAAAWDAEYAPVEEKLKPLFKPVLVNKNMGLAVFVRTKVAATQPPQAAHQDGGADAAGAAKDVATPGATPFNVDAVSALCSPRGAPLVSQALPEAEKRNFALLTRKFVRAKANNDQSGVDHLGVLILDLLKRNGVNKEAILQQVNAPPPTDPPEPTAPPETERLLRKKTKKPKKKSADEDEATAAAASSEAAAAASDATAEPTPKRKKGKKAKKPSTAEDEDGAQSPANEEEKEKKETSGGDGSNEDAAPAPAKKKSGKAKKKPQAEQEENQADAASSQASADDANKETAQKKKKAANKRKPSRDEQEGAEEAEDTPKKQKKRSRKSADEETAASGSSEPPAGEQVEEAPPKKKKNAKKAKSAAADESEGNAADDQEAAKPRRARKGKQPKEDAEEAAGFGGGGGQTGRTLQQFGDWKLPKRKASPIACVDHFTPCIAAGCKPALLCQDSSPSNRAIMHPARFLQLSRYLLAEGLPSSDHLGLVFAVVKGHQAAKVAILGCYPSLAAAAFAGIADAKGLKVHPSAATGCEPDTFKGIVADASAVIYTENLADDAAVDVVITSSQFLNKVAGAAAAVAASKSVVVLGTAVDPLSKEALGRLSGPALSFQGDDFNIGVTWYYDPSSTPAAA